MTDTPPPLAFRWDGDAMVPLNGKRADVFYTVGERYIMAPVSERSQASHAHEFAWLREAWMSLPDHLAERFTSPEALRKFALIKAGYCDSSTIVCASKAEAQRVAAFIRPMDEFAIVMVEGATVTRFTARSQSRRAMGGKEFNASKQAIMDVVAQMLGAAPAELPKHEAA